MDPCREDWSWAGLCCGHFRAFPLGCEVGTVPRVHGPAIPSHGREVGRVTISAKNPHWTHLRLARLQKPVQRHGPGQSGSRLGKVDGSLVSLFWCPGSGQRYTASGLFSPPLNEIFKV